MLRKKEKTTRKTSSFELQRQLFTRKMPSIKTEQREGASLDVSASLLLLLSSFVICCLLTKDKERPKDHKKGENKQSSKEIDTIRFY